MKRKLLIIFTLVILVSIPNHVYAYDYNNLGYFNADIFLQNDLTKYSSEFDDALDYWNNAGVLERSIVVNTVSSSYITNFDYADNENYWYESQRGVYAKYEVESQLPYACSCHTVTSFSIKLNEGELDDPGYTSSRNKKAVIGTIVHELGHAFGLIDYENGEYWSSSVMDYRRVLYEIYTPQTRDINNANACWEVHR